MIVTVSLKEPWVQSFYTLILFLSAYGTYQSFRILILSSVHTESDLKFLESWPADTLFEWPVVSWLEFTSSLLPGSSESTVSLLWSFLMLFTCNEVLIFCVTRPLPSWPFIFQLYSALHHNVSCSLILILCILPGVVLISVLVSYGCPKKLSQGCLA